MRVLIDTNIVLDVLLKRAPWVSEAAKLWEANDEAKITGYLSASTLTDIFYITRRTKDWETARQAVKICLEAFEIFPVDRSLLEHALSLSGKDFEDNLQMACAIHGGFDAIITRNQDDFKGSPIPVLSPRECMDQLG